MTDHSVEIMNETLDAVKTNSELLFNSGVVHGVTIVKNLITENEEVKDLDTLTQVLDLFINKYNGNSENNEPAPETNEDLETVPANNLVLEDIDDSDGNVYRGYIIPTYEELASQNSKNITVLNVDETERLDTGVPLLKYADAEDKDDAVAAEVRNFVDFLLNKDILMMAKPKKLSDYYRQSLNE